MTYIGNPKGGFMEGSALADKGPKGRRSPHGSFHQALIKAKTQKRKVKLVLAIDTDYTDGQGVCSADVLTVDRTSTLFKIDGREVWVLEAFLVSVEMV